MTHFTRKITKNTPLLAIIALFCTFLAIFLISACNKLTSENTVTINCPTKVNYTKDVNAAQRTAMIAYCTANNILSHPRLTQINFASTDYSER